MLSSFFFFDIFHARVAFETEGVDKRAAVRASHAAFIFFNTFCFGCREQKWFVLVSFDSKFRDEN